MKKSVLPISLRADAAFPDGRLPAQPADEAAPTPRPQGVVRDFMDEVEDDADDFFANRPSAAKAASHRAYAADPRSPGPFLFADEAVENWPEASARPAKAVSFVDEAVDDYIERPHIAASGAVTFVDDDLDNPNPKSRQSAAPRPSGRPSKRRGGWTRSFGWIIALLLLLAGGLAAYRTYVARNAEPSSGPSMVSPAESLPSAAVPPRTPPAPPSATQSAPVSSAAPSIEPARASPSAPAPPAAESGKQARTADRPPRRKPRPRPAPSETKAASPAAPVDNVACILPSGQEVRMPYLSCRARSGVIYR